MDENIKITYVVDASFILSYLLPDEKNSDIQELFNKFGRNEITFISHSLLPFEILNSLKMAYRRKRLSLKQTQELGKVFLDYQIKLENIDYHKVLLLALKEELTVYDASYVYLARSEKIELLTLDKKLLKLKK